MFDVEKVLQKEFKAWRRSPQRATAALRRWAPQLGAARLVQLLGAMKQTSLETNVYHFGAAISACASWLTALELLKFMKLQQVQPNVVVYGGAIGLCDWPMALHLLDQMHQDQVAPNVVVYNAAIKAADWMHACALLEQMHQELVQPDVVTYNSLLRSCNGQWSLKLLQQMKRKKLWPDLVSYNTAMDVLQKSSSWREALEMWRTMPPSPDVVTMNTAMLALVKGSRWPDALVVLRSMPEKHLSPSFISYNIAIKACEEGGRWDVASELLSSMARRRLKVTRISYNSFLSVLQKCGQWQLALEILGSVPGGPDTVSFNAVMSACERVGQWRFTLQLLRQMQQDQAPPDEVSYSAAISACDKVGQWEVALHLLSSMALARVAIDLIACNSAMAACSRAGEWPHALQLLRCMADFLIEADAASYNAVACECLAVRVGSFPGRAWPLVVAIVAEMLDEAVRPNSITVTTAMASIEAAEAWSVALELIRLGAVRSSADAMDLAVVACCQAGAWPEALRLLDATPSSAGSAQSGSSPGLSALLMVCEQEHLKELQASLLTRAASAMVDGTALARVVQAEPNLLGSRVGRGPTELREQLLPTLLRTEDFTRTKLYSKELLLLRSVLVADPSPASALEAMDSLGRSLGEAGVWAKFAGGAKSSTLCAAAAGICGREPLVLEIGTYCGYSAISLAALGAQVVTVEMDPFLVGIARCVLAHVGLSSRVSVFTGHSKLLLPRLRRISGANGYKLIFMDRWGAQYPEDLMLIEELGLLSLGGVLVADNVLRTVAAEFLWRVCKQDPGKYETMILPVTEVSEASDEDWMSVSVHTAAAGPGQSPTVIAGESDRSLPGQWMELQKRSELMRVRTTNSFVSKSEIQEVKEQAKKIFLMSSVGPS
ncbi:unnamed protein product [Durusdinium trenchii]|uniref:Catechol O-methyltransferase n=1 Tax=Durusdinium trenchii TaxID=1381693 RepID=A0ABP0PP22_9DINO